MSFDDFFDNEDGKVEATDNISDEIENELDEIAMSVVEEPAEPGPELMEEFTSQGIDMDSDAEDLFLLDVIYEPERNAAQLVFYHTETRTLYRWNDNTDHKPYFLTDISPEIILSNSKIVNSKEFVSLEQVKKFDLLTNKEKEFTKIYGKTPLSIGGGNYSLRKEFTRAYEADIRYHLNYISDRQITPGTYYDVKNGELVPSDYTIDSAISDELLEAFKGESQDELDMLDEYMPLLFQEMPDLLRCAFDIEVDSDKNNLPNASNPIQAIISIALADTDGRKICWVLNRDVVNQDEIFEGVILKRFDNETNLLEDFFGVIDEYPVVLSFNGDNFDCPYIFNRARNLEIPEADIPIIIRRTESKFKSSIHLDLYQFFKQAAIRLYAFSGKYDSASLDSLSKSLLGESKLDHPDVWINDMDLKMLVKYNILDAELTLQLTQFDNNITLNLMFILMRISKMPIFDFSRSAVSTWLKMWIIYEHRKRGNIVPLKSDILEAKGGTATSEAIIDGKKFQGAIVLDPKPGIWWNVHVMDFASLYPSIIKTRNLSYETIRCDHAECRSNIVPEVRHWVCTKRAGIFSILLGFIRDTRVKWFKPRSGKSNEDEVDRRRNNIIQASLKVLINAGYGVFGSENFDFYCPPVAESTTAYARDAIMTTKDYVENQLGVDVIYGDTDSVFIYNPTQEQIDDVINWGIKTIGIELETDYEFRYVVFSTLKKNYFGITKDGYPIVKGLAAKKSNTPLIIRDTFTEVLKILSDVHTQDDMENAKDLIFDKVKEMITRLEKGKFTIEEVLTRTSLSKKIKDYDTWTTSIQCVAQLINAGIKKPNEFNVGDRLEYVKVRQPVSVNIPDGLAFSKGIRKTASVIPTDLIKDVSKLGGEMTITTAESTFSQILISLGLSWDKIIGVTTIDDFF